MAQEQRVPAVRSGVWLVGWLTSPPLHRRRQSDGIAALVFLWMSTGCSTHRHGLRVNDRNAATDRDHTCEDSFMLPIQLCFRKITIAQRTHSTDPVGATFSSLSSSQLKSVGRARQRSSLCFDHSCTAFLGMSSCPHVGHKRSLQNSHLETRKDRASRERSIL